MIVLRLSAGEKQGKVIVVGDGLSFTVGRSDESDLVFEDRLISRVHCRFENQGDVCHVEDLESRNGTFLNTQRVEGKVATKPGQRIRFGHSVAEILVSPKADSVLGQSKPEDVIRIGKQHPSDSAAASVGGSSGTAAEAIFLCVGCSGLIPEAQVVAVSGKPHCAQCGRKVESAVVGQYRLLEVIGRGTKGTVYRAQHETIRKEVAIKVLREDLAADRRNVQRFLREARAGAELNHPNMVQILDAGSEGKIYYLVLELVSGKTLDLLVKEKGPLSLKQALDFTIQICRALNYAYQKKIVHRDIRPANVLVTPSGTAKLFDLGMAKALERIAVPGLSTSSVEFENVYYASPEVLFAPEKVDHRADVYSLGSTYYFMLTGEPPFRASSMEQALEKIRAGDLGFLEKSTSRLPQEALPFLRRMLAQERKDRYADAQELLSELTRFYLQRYSSTYYVPEGVGEDAQVFPEQRATGSDIRLAVQVQKKLVAEEFPILPGYELAKYYKPAREVGGDYLDLFPVGRGQHSLVIADVSGKGISGAMVMVMVRSVFRMLGGNRLSPKRTLLEANRIIGQDIKPGMFVTVIYGLLDVDKKLLSLSCAGHSAPLVWERSGGPAEYVELGGMAIGVGKGAEFEQKLQERVFSLRPGLTFCFYTDGVVAEKNDKGEGFGSENLREIVSRNRKQRLELLVGEVTKRLEAHRGKSRQSDDITLFAMSFLGESKGSAASGDLS